MTSNTTATSWWQSLNPFASAAPDNKVNGNPDEKEQDPGFLGSITQSVKTITQSAKTISKLAETIKGTPAHEDLKRLTNLLQKIVTNKKEEKSFLLYAIKLLKDLTAQNNASIKISSEEAGVLSSLMIQLQALVKPAEGKRAPQDEKSTSLAEPISKALGLEASIADAEVFQEVLIPDDLIAKIEKTLPVLDGVISKNRSFKEHLKKEGTDLIYAYGKAADETLNGTASPLLEKAYEDLVNVHYALSQNPKENDPVKLFPLIKRCAASLTEILENEKETLQKKLNEEQFAQIRLIHSLFSSISRVEDLKDFDWEAAYPVVENSRNNMRALLNMDDGALKKPMRDLTDLTKKLDSSVVKAGAVANNTLDKASLCAKDIDEKLKSRISELSGVVSQVEVLPDTMVRNANRALQGLPPITTQVPEKKEEKKDSNVSSAPVQQEKPFKEFLKDAQTYIEELLYSSAGSAKEKALGYAAGKLVSTLGFLRPQMEGSPEGLQKIDQLSTALQAIANGKEKDWSQILNMLSDLEVSVFGTQVYTFPSSSPSLTPPSAANFRANIEAEKKAMNLTEPKEAVVNYKDRIQKQKEQLITNLGEYTPLRTVYEKICGLRPSQDKFYLELMEKAHKAANPAVELRKLFFKEIDKQPMFFLRKWAAKLSYYILAPITQFSMNAFFDQFLAFAMKRIEEYKNNEFKNFSTKTISNFDRFLSTLSGAHKRAAANNEVNHSFLKMVEKELEKPFCNEVEAQGYTPKKLYAKMAGECINQFVPKLGWSDKIRKAFGKVAFSEASSWARFNPALKGVMKVLSTLVQAIIYIPEWILNKALWLILKLFIVKHDVVEGILNKGVDSIKDSNGYSDAVNTIILAQLEKIWTLVSNPSAREDLGKDISSAHKQELTKIVKELFFVLKLNLKASHAEANKEPSLIDIGVKEFDNLLINDVTTTTATLIGVALKAILEEKQFESQLYHFLELVNKSFKSGAALSTKELEQFAEKEKRITQLLNDILTHAIRTAMEKKLNVSESPARNAHLQQIRILQGNCTNYLAKVKEANCVYTSLAPFDKQLYLPHIAFKEKLADLKERVKADKDLNMGYITALNAHYDKLFTSFEVLGDTLKTMREALTKQPSTLPKHNEKITATMGQITSHLQKIEPPPFVDLASKQNGFIVQTLEDITIARIRSYVEELVIMMRQPHNYRHLFHHMLIIPYLEGERT